MFHLQHASITLQITFTTSFSHQIYWIWLPYLGCASLPGFIAFKSSPYIHFNAFFAFRIQFWVDLSIAVFDAFFAFTALSVIQSNSKIDLEESLVRLFLVLVLQNPLEVLQYPFLFGDFRFSHSFRNFLKKSSGHAISDNTGYFDKNSAVLAKVEQKSLQE